MDGPFYVDTRTPHIGGDAASVTLAATNKALVPLANLPVLGSNYFSYVGKAVRITMFGRMTTAATPGNGQFNLYWGSGIDATGTAIGSSSTFALTANQTSMTWVCQFWVRARSLGATGSLLVLGEAGFNPAVVSSTLQPIMIPASIPAPVTVDLTAANVLSPQFLRSGSTVETMQVHDFLFEALN